MLSREEFEDSILREDVAEYYLSKTKEEIEEELGSAVAKMIGFEQKNIHHCYDVWEHSLRTVEAIKEENLSPEEYKLLRIVTFFHDIGKPDVSGFNPKTGQQTFYGHAERSVEVAKPILENLGYNPEEIEKISFFIGHHDDFISYKSKLLPEMENSAFARGITSESVAEKLIENTYNFTSEQMGYDKYQIKYICYALAHEGREPVFRGKNGPLNIKVNMRDVQEKLARNNKANFEYNPNLRDYELLLEVCKADSISKAEKVILDGKEIGSSKEKVETIKNIETVLTEAYKIKENLERKISMQEILKLIEETKTVVTHFGDDLDNKSSVYALEKWAKEQGVLAEDETLKVERVPAGQIKEGMLNIDTGGHKGSRFEESGTIVIDGDPANGVKSAAEALANLGIYVPEQIVELADTKPNHVSSLDSRSGLALVRSLSGEQAFKLAEAGLIDKSLTDEQLEEFGLVEAHQKQQGIIDNAVEKIEKYTVEMPNGEKIVLAEEQILAGSAIAYEKGINYFASASEHFDKDKNPDGVTFAITCKPGVKLPEEVINYGNELVEQYRIDENSSGVFVNPNGQMIVAGGFKNPEFKIPNETIKGMLKKIESKFTGKDLDKVKEQG